jgi:hypothetical protein
MFADSVMQCVRVAEHSTRKILIEELLNRTRLEKLLRDSYGNYCVQVCSCYGITLIDADSYIDCFGLRRAYAVRSAR